MSGYSRVQLTFVLPRDKLEFSNRQFHIVAHFKEYESRGISLPRN